MATIDERLVSSLLGVMRSLERPLIKHVTAEKLTATQFAVLEMLFHKGELTVNEIIEGVFSTSGNISVVIDNLIKAGLLNKKLNPNDGRSRLIYLTAIGREKIEDYYPRHKNELRRLMSGLETTEKKALIKTLIALRQNILTNSQNEEH